MSSDENYEYRPVSRYKYPDSDWSEWSQVATRQAAGRAYPTLTGAKSVATRDKRFYNNHYWGIRPGPIVEYKIQRRPFGDWEDIDV